MTRMGTNKVSITIIPHEAEIASVSDARRAHDVSLFLEIFIKNGEHFAVPEDIDKAGPGRLSLRLDNLVDRNLNQRTGRIRKAAAWTRLELDGVNRHGYLITNWWLTATHDRALLLG